jgi:hypothetical protein
MITPRDEQVPPAPRPSDAEVEQDEDDTDPDWLGRMMAEQPPDPILDVDELAEQ